MDFSTASPFSDCKVQLLLKVQVDDNEPLFDNLKQNPGDPPPVIYDLEAYQLPAVLRRVLKSTKLDEVITITSSRRNKLIDNLPDETYGIFDIDKIGAFEKTVKITFQLLRIEQKIHVMKVLVAEQLERLTFLQAVANQFAQRHLDETRTNYLRQNDMKKA